MPSSIASRAWSVNHSSNSAASCVNTRFFLPQQSPLGQYYVYTYCIAHFCTILLNYQANCVACFRCPPTSACCRPHMSTVFASTPGRRPLSSPIGGAGLSFLRLRLMRLQKRKTLGGHDFK